MNRRKSAYCTDCHRVAGVIVEALTEGMRLPLCYGCIADRRLRGRTVEVLTPGPVERRGARSVDYAIGSVPK